MTSVHRPLHQSDATREPIGSWRFRALLAAAFFILAICWSPLLPGLMSINSSLAFVAAFIIFAGLVCSARGVDMPPFVLALFLLMCCMLLLAATTSLTLLARTAPLPLLIFAAHQTASIRKLPEAICDALTAFLVTGVVLSIIGFAYAFTGGQPLLSIENPDGRENALYLTTMTNFWIGNIIRPSFIYDEPGAFSFLLCATVALRELLGRGSRQSFLLMFGGLVTFSLTHILILFVFLATRVGVMRTLLLATVLVGGVYTASQESDALDFFVTRFSVEDGRFAGDNRSDQIENLLEIINPEIFFFGDVACHARPDRTCSEHGDISSSPATPVYRGGLLLLAVQLAVHASLVIAFFRRKRFRFPALALSILLLQRPYFEGFGYGFVTYMLVFLMFKRSSPRVRGFPIRLADAR